MRAILLLYAPQFFNQSISIFLQFFCNFSSFQFNIGNLKLYDSFTLMLHRLLADAVEAVQK